MHTTAFLLGVKIPTGAIERVTRGAGRQSASKRCTVQASLHNRTQCFNSGHDTVGSFAITSIGDRLAAAAVAFVAELRHHDHGFGLAAAANRKSSGQRPALNPHGKVHARAI